MALVLAVVFGFLILEVAAIPAHSLAASSFFDVNGTV